MPELPEVETVRRGLAGRILDNTIERVAQHRPDLRYPLPERLPMRLAGRRILEVGRRAKYLLLHLEGDLCLILHLGMSGRLLLRDGFGHNAGPHDHVILYCRGAEAETAVVFNDVRRFGMMDLVHRSDLPAYGALAALGPEPLTDEFDGAALAAALSGRASPIKTALLDQRVVAGLGNIYVCEALFEAGLSPRRRAGTVTGRRAYRLAAAVKDVLNRAIAAGGSSLRDYVNVDGELGYFQHAWAVYGREGNPCRDCEGTCPGGVRRIMQSGRSSFFCPRKQR